MSVAEEEDMAGDTRLSERPRERNCAGAGTLANLRK